MKKRDIILILVILVLGGAYLILRSRKPVEKPLKVFSTDSLSIGKIEIKGTEESITLEPKEDGWWIVKPVLWRVDPHKMQELFRDVINISVPSILISESPEAVKRYKLDEPHALQVMIYGKSGKINDHVYFGSSGAPFDYMKFANDNMVYQTKTLVVNRFDPILPYWRDPRILDIEDKQISHIEVKYSGNEYTLTKKAPFWQYTDKYQDFQIVRENRQMMRVLNILRLLETRVFFESELDQYKGLFESSPHCTVRVYLTDGKVRYLDFIKFKGMYILRLDKDESVLYEVVGDTLDRFTRSHHVFAERYDLE